MRAWPEHAHEHAHEHRSRLSNTQSSPPGVLLGLPPHLQVVQFNPDFVISSLNVHRLLITSIMLASKFFDDVYYNNAYYARVGGISNSEVNSLEGCTSPASGPANVFGCPGMAGCPARLAGRDPSCPPCCVSPFCAPWLSRPPRSRLPPRRLVSADGDATDDLLLALCSAGAV